MIAIGFLHPRSDFRKPLCRVNEVACGEIARRIGPKSKAPAEKREGRRERDNLSTGRKKILGTDLSDQHPVKPLL
jgi:hypothetical protein